MRSFTIAAALVALGMLAGGAVRAADPAAKDAKKGNSAEHLLARFDTNGDGALDAKELAAMVAAHDKRAAENGKGVKAPPKLSAEELLKKFDTNGDGKLEASELEAVGKELRAHHQKGKGAAAP